MTSYDDFLKRQQEEADRAQAERDKYAAAAADQVTKQQAQPASSQHYGQQQY